jgi:hypothetical protein
MNPDFKEEVSDRYEYQQRLLELIEKGYSTRKARRYLERKSKRKRS